MSRVVNLLANLANYADSGALTRNSGSASARATIVSVDDPQEMGRVLVVFDAMNGQDIPQEVGAGEYSDPRLDEPGNHSHWIDVSPAFKGKQSPGLVGKRVTISSTNGDLSYAILGDVIYDPDNLTESAKGRLKVPNNSSMTRLPIYPSGSLPPPGEENHGCMVVESGGPMSSDWMCVCLRRSGSYIWVRHVDLQHGHAGQNDGDQKPDSSGDIETPVNEQTVWDYVFPTSTSAMPKKSSSGTSPRSNPYGGQATWHSPP